MQCDDVRLALSASEGAPPTEETRLHLASCPACRGWMAALDSLDARLSAWVVPEPGPAFDAAVLARLRRRRSPRWLLVAAEVAIFLLGGLAGVLGARVLRSPPAPATASDPAALGGGTDLAELYLRELP